MPDNFLELEMNLIPPPSMEFSIKKAFSEYLEIQKTISLKEIEFKRVRKWKDEYALQTADVEKQLGDLYLELNYLYIILFPKQKQIDVSI